MWPAADIPGQRIYLLIAGGLLLLGLLAFIRGWWYDRAKGRMRCRRCGFPAILGDGTAPVGEPGGLDDTPTRYAPGDHTDGPHESHNHRWRVSEQWSCTECGWQPKRMKDLARPRRSRRWLAVSVLLVIGAWSGWYAVHVQFRRLKLQEPTATAVVPTTWWIAVLPYSSGNEDPIVYHRAYPQGKMAGSAFSPQYSTHGRGSSITVDSPSELFRWQHRCATHGFAQSMKDDSRSASERAIWVWLYASFSGVDTAAEEELLLSLLSETDEDLLFAVLDECVWHELLTEPVVSAAAQVLETTSYSEGMRRFAGRVIGCSGPLSVPHVAKWIDRGDPELDQYIYDTLIEAAIGSHKFDLHDRGYMQQLLKLILASPRPDDQDFGLQFFDYYYDDFWMTANEFYALFTLLKTEFEVILDDLDHPVRDEAIRVISSCPDNIRYHFGPDDMRTVEAWAWLMDRPGEDVALEAAFGIRELAWDLGARDAKNAAAHDRLSEIVEQALQRDPSEDVRLLLLDAEDALRD